MLVQTSAVIAMAAALAAPGQFTDYQDALEACDGNTECAEAMFNHTNEFANPNGVPGDAGVDGGQSEAYSTPGSDLYSPEQVTVGVYGDRPADASDQQLVLDFVCAGAELNYTDQGSVRVDLNSKVNIPVTWHDTEWGCTFDVAGETVRTGSYEVSWDSTVVSGNSLSADMRVSWTRVESPEAPAAPEGSDESESPTSSESEGSEPEAAESEAADEVVPSPAEEESGSGSLPFGSEGSRDSSSGFAASELPFESEEEAVEARVSDLATQNTASEATTATQSAPEGPGSTRVLGWGAMAAGTLWCGRKLLAKMTTLFV